MNNKSIVSRKRPLLFTASSSIVLVILLFTFLTLGCERPSPAEKVAVETVNEIVQEPQHETVKVLNSLIQRNELLPLLQAAMRGGTDPKDIVLMLNAASRDPQVAVELFEGITKGLSTEPIRRQFAASNDFRAAMIQTFDTHFAAIIDSALGRNRQSLDREFKLGLHHLFITLVFSNPEDYQKNEMVNVLKRWGDELLQHANTGIAPASLRPLVLKRPPFDRYGSSYVLGAILGAFEGAARSSGPDEGRLQFAQDLAGKFSDELRGDNEVNVLTTFQSVYVSTVRSLNSSGIK